MQIGDFDERSCFCYTFSITRYIIRLTVYVLYISNIRCWGPTVRWLVSDRLSDSGAQKQLFRHFTPSPSLGYGDEANDLGAPGLGTILEPVWIELLIITPIHKLIFRDGSNALEPPNRPSFTDFAEEATHYVDLNSINQRAYSVATADYESRPITESISTAKLTSLREGDTLRQWLQKLEASTAPSRGFMTDRIRKQVYQALRPDSIGSTPTLAALVARKIREIAEQQPHQQKGGIKRVMFFLTAGLSSRINALMKSGSKVTAESTLRLVSFQALRDEGIYWDTFTEPTRLVYRDKRPICILFRKYRQFVLDFQPIQKEDIEEAVFKPLSREEEAPGTQDRQRQQKLAFGMPD
ncbi:integrase core domain-containing protein [Hirsutella rhossiliensis]